MNRGTVNHFWLQITQVLNKRPVLLSFEEVYFDTMLFYVRELVLVIYSYLILDAQVHSSWLLVGIN